MLQGSDDRRFLQPVEPQAGNELVGLAQGFYKPLLSRAEYLLRQSVEVPEDPQQAHAIAKTRPNVTGPERGKNAEHTFV